MKIVKHPALLTPAQAEMIHNAMELINTDPEWIGSEDRLLNLSAAATVAQLIAILSALPPETIVTGELDEPLVVGYFADAIGEDTHVVLRCLK
jgi:hypothetical protein